MFYVLIGLSMLFFILTLIFNFRYFISISVFFISLMITSSIYLSFAYSLLTLFLCLSCLIINIINAYFIIRLVTYGDIEEIKDNEEIKEIVKKIKENNNEKD